MGLAYERIGSGPPLVLLHGVGHRRQAWGAVLDRLTPHRDVILVDLPGHGESPCPGRSTTITSRCGVSRSSTAPQAWRRCPTPCSRTSGGPDPLRS